MIVEFYGGPLDGDVRDVTEEVERTGVFTIQRPASFDLPPVALADDPVQRVKLWTGTYRKRSSLYYFIFDWHGWADDPHERIA